jgi:hypothetical protein
LTPQIAVVVEGQTEEAFVKQVLQPHIGFEVAYLTPIIVHTSRAANGQAYKGGGSWAHYRKQLLNLLSQRHWSRVTTLIDFYGYPSDAPSCHCESHHVQPQCVQAREEAMRRDLGIDDERFLPFIALHEFETLIIAAGSQQGDVLGDVDTAKTFAELVSDHGGNAELINDGALTAPSKRVLAALPEYRKVRDGVAILDGQLDLALTVTPRFASWVNRVSSPS